MLGVALAGTTSLVVTHSDTVGVTPVFTKNKNSIRNDIPEK